MRIGFAALVASSLFGCVADAQDGRLPPIPVLPAPPPPWPIPPGIIGETPEAVIAKLGAPKLDDVRQPTRTIDFAGDGCVLTVFFRLHDGVWNAYEMYHILPNGEIIDPNPCYQSIVEPPRAER